jgi:hypothetical protein
MHGYEQGIGMGIFMTMGMGMAKNSPGACRKPPAF